MAKDSGISSINISEGGFDPIVAKPINTMWGVAPVAPLHLGYDSFINLQKDLLKDAKSHTVLLADNHAMMSHGLTYSEISKRATYYEVYLRHCCSLNAKYVSGSTFQTKHDYVESLYSIISKLRFSKIKRTLSKVSKQGGVDSAYASSLLYSVMQCLDCCYLNVDTVVAGPDQQKIYRLLDDFPDAISYNSYLSRPDHYYYFPLGYDIAGKPLNQSTSSTRISIHETRDNLEQKVRKMYAPPYDQPLEEGRVNALIEHFKYSVFPWISEPIIVSGNNGLSSKEFYTFQDFLNAYIAGEITPQQCKKSLFEYLWQRLSDIQRSVGTEICDWISIELINGIRK